MPYLKPALFVITLVILSVIASKIYQAGYNEAELKQAAAIEAERTKMIADFKLNLTQAKTTSLQWKNKAIEAQEQLKVKPTKVIEYATQIEKSSDCSFLGSDFRIMHNVTVKRFTGRTITVE